jgi:type I restriction enzyme S subunit
MDRTWVNAGLKCAKIRASDVPSLLVQRVARIRGNSRCTTSYVAQVLQSHRFIQHIKGTQTESAVPHISAQQIREFQAWVPTLPEQQKIADILGTWDEALEKLDALIAAKDCRKQALMQQLLHAAARKVGHGHARYRLGNVVERVTRKNTVGNDNVLTISAQDGLINQREYFNRNVAGADLSGYLLLQRGEFAYNRSSSLGFPYGALKRLDRYDAGVVSTLYLCFRIRDTSTVSADYLSHYFDGGYLNPGLRSVAKEGARAHGLLNVTADEFMELDIFLPPLPLQQKIAAVLDAADAELRLLRQQRAALDQQKRGLMQQLLTGRTRVKTPT